MRAGSNSRTGPGRRGTRAQAAALAAFDYYVDSVNGNNANSGLTAALAVQTIAAAQALLSAGKRLGLARGSTWREQFTVPADNISIGVYGSGNMPVLDGTDIVTTGWTQPDAGTYPNVWSRSWTRAQAATTGEAKLGYWQAGVRTTRRADLTALQAGSNGDWHTTSLTGTTVTVSVRAAADPNSDGILREITKRSHAISGHPVTVGSTKTGQAFTGPIELKRAVEHYNSLSMGSGVAARMFVRDGNIHNAVSQGDFTDVVMTEASPDSSPSFVAFYNSVSAGFNPIATRVLGLLPGGSGRVLNGSGFYGHGGTGRIGSFTLNACMTRGADFANSDADLMTVTGGYAEDAPTREINAGSADNHINHFLAWHSAASPFPANNDAIFTAGGSASQLSASHVAIFRLNGGGANQSNITYKHTYFHCSVVVTSPANPFAFGFPDIRYCIAQGARTYNSFSTGYTGDFNVFYFVNQAAPQFQLNTTVYGDLATFQAASGQDANSVFLKHADQVSGNGIAFWKGVALGMNNGPADCDFRINPSAKVYKGDGSALTGVFADGMTPITMAGAQERWDFNLREIVPGPPTRRPILPVSIAEMRTYLESPASWNFYP